MGKRAKWGIDKKENEAPYSLLPRYNIRYAFLLFIIYIYYFSITLIYYDIIMML
ncbi:unnamed protein product [marine sediment metagenome]|uniref:Uncharacterized protein n=1 Tax=marine sediment metagenome TaxID=412755 RepID=X0WM25_9ZZZZ